MLNEGITKKTRKRKRKLNFEATTN